VEPLHGTFTGPPHETIIVGLWRIYDFNHGGTNENDIVHRYEHNIIRSLNGDKIVVNIEC